MFEGMNSFGSTCVCVLLDLEFVSLCFMSFIKLGKTLSSISLNIVSDSCYYFILSETPVTQMLEFLVLSLGSQRLY